jgi:predicted transcriptional regulator
MEHSLHLGVGHLLARITPARTRKAQDAGKEDESSFDSADSDCISSILSDALRKLLALIRQVRIMFRKCNIY